MPHLSVTLAPADSLFEVILEYLGACLTVKNDFLTNILTTGIVLVMTKRMVESS